MRVRRIAILCLTVVLVSGPVLASKRVKQPTLADLANVWVGSTVDGGLEYFRLDLKPDGSGVLTVQYLPDAQARAYRVTRTTLHQYKISFDIDPLEADAEPVTIRGQAIPSRMALEVKGVRHDWKCTVVLQRYSALMDRLRAVTQRAEALPATTDAR
jgi:hypothetical protein